MIIRVEDLHYRFPDGTTALRGVDLGVNVGEFLVIAGRNGSGKTVFMKHLNGLLKPTGGRVLIHEKDTRHHPDEARRTVGLVFQNPDSQFVGQTVREDIRFGPENLKLPEQDISFRVDHALEATGLSSLANRRPHTLSGGEKRRLAVAGVLAMEPEVLVLDEPFSGLDLEGTREVLGAILDLLSSGHTIILITHEVEKVLAHAGRLVVMNRGTVIGDGHPSTLLETAGDNGIYIPPGIPLEEMSWMD